MICPNCGKEIKTVVKRKRTCKQITTASLLSLGIIVTWYCAYKVWTDQSKMDHIHSCSNCHSELSRYNPTIAYS